MINPVMKHALLELGFVEKTEQTPVEAQLLPESSKAKSNAGAGKVTKSADPKANSPKPASRPKKVKTVKKPQKKQSKKARKQTSTPSFSNVTASHIPDQFKPRSMEEVERRRAALSAIYDRPIQPPPTKNLTDLSDVELLERWTKLFRFASGKNTERYGDLMIDIDQIEAEWERRSAQNMLHGGQFEWPTLGTYLGLSNTSQIGWDAAGYLRILGYSVAKSSDLSGIERQELLSYIFKVRLPPLNSAKYRLSWGLPGTSHRLEKIADSIASFIRLRRGKLAKRSASATERWQADLDFLYQRFYVGKFNFSWPAS